MNDSSHLRHNQATKRNRVLRSEHQFSFPAQPLFGTYIGKFDLQFDLVSRCYLLRPEKKNINLRGNPLREALSWALTCLSFIQGRTEQLPSTYTSPPHLESA